MIFCFRHLFQLHEITTSSSVSKPFVFLIHYCFTIVLNESNNQCDLLIYKLYIVLTKVTIISNRKLLKKSTFLVTSQKRRTFPQSSYQYFPFIFTRNTVWQFTVLKFMIIQNSWWRGNKKNIWKEFNLKLLLLNILEK